MLLKYKIAMRGFCPAAHPQWDGNRFWDPEPDPAGIGPNFHTVNAWLMEANNEGRLKPGLQFEVWNATGGDLREARHLVGRVYAGVEGRVPTYDHDEIIDAVDGIIAEYESGTKFRERGEGKNAA